MESKNDNRGWKKPVSKHFNLILEIFRSVIPSFLRKEEVLSDTEVTSFRIQRLRASRVSIVPRLRISLFDNCSFSFLLERKKVFGEILKKIVTIQKYPPFFHLFLSLSWKNFLMKIVIERSYIFSPFKLLENRIEYFSFPKVHFFKIAKTFRRRQN